MLKALLVGVLVTTACLQARAGGLTCGGSLVATDVDHSDFVKQNPKAAKKLTEDLTSAGFLLGKTQSFALSNALTANGLLHKSATDELAPKAPYAISEFDDDYYENLPGRHFVHKSYKEVSEIFDKGQDLQFSQKLADDMISVLDATFSRPGAFATPAARLEAARVQSENLIQVPLKEFLRLQEIYWDLASNPVEMAFYKKLLVESNPLALKMIYARTSSLTDHILRAIPLLAMPAIAGVVPSLAFGYDTGDIVGGVFAGIIIGGVADRFYSLRMTSTRIERMTALPGNIIRRALGKKQLKTYLRQQMLPGSTVANWNVLEGKTDGEQLKLIESAVVKEEKVFNRVSLQNLRPDLDLSSLKNIGSFGKTLPNMAGELADRFQAIGEEKSKNVQDLQLLTSTVTSANESAKTGELREALSARLSQLDEIQGENEQLIADLTLLKQKTEDHLHEIAAKKDDVPSSRTDLQKELNSVTSELYLTDNLVLALSEQSQNLSHQMIEERDLIRQVRAAGTAKTIVAGKSAQDVEGSKASVEKLSALYKKAFAGG